MRFLQPVTGKELRLFLADKYGIEISGRENAFEVFCGLLQDLYEQNEKLQARVDVLENK